MYLVPGGVKPHPSGPYHPRCMHAHAWADEYSIVRQAVRVAKLTEPLHHTLHIQGRHVVLHSISTQYGRDNITYIQGRHVVLHSMINITLHIQGRHVVLHSIVDITLHIYRAGMWYYTVW